MFQEISGAALVSRYLSLIFSRGPKYSEYSEVIVGGLEHMGLLMFQEHKFLTKNELKKILPSRTEF